MVWVRSPAYFYKRGETFYFSRAVPSDLQHRFDKRKVKVSLRTKSQIRARKSAAALSDRLERYWDSLRMEMIYSRELGLSVIGGAAAQHASKLTFDEVLKLYRRLKGLGKTRLFFEGSERSMRYLKDCLGHNNINPQGTEGQKTLSREGFEKTLIQQRRMGTSVEMLETHYGQVVNRLVATQITKTRSRQTVKVTEKVYPF